MYRSIIHTSVILLHRRGSCPSAAPSVLTPPIPQWGPSVEGEWGAPPRPPARCNFKIVVCISYGDFAVPHGRNHCRLVGATRRVAPTIRRIPFQRLGVGPMPYGGIPVERDASSWDGTSTIPIKTRRVGCRLPDGCQGLPPQGIGDPDPMQRHQQLWQSRRLEVGQLQSLWTGP